MSTRQGGNTATKHHHGPPKGPCGNRICNLDELCWTRNEANETVTLQDGNASAQPDQEWKLNYVNTRRNTGIEQNGSTLVTFSLMGSHDIYARYCWKSMGLVTAVSADLATVFYADQDPNTDSEFKLSLKHDDGQEWYIMANRRKTLMVTQDPESATLWTYNNMDGCCC